VRGINILNLLKMRNRNNSGQFSYKFSKEEFIREVERIHGIQIEVVGRYKNLISPVLIKDKYGLIQLKTARQLLKSPPSIKSAINKTEYFMAQLKECQPEIYDFIKPLSEYKSAKEKMIFDTMYGPVSTSPDTLLAGHIPTIRSAVNRKEYFKNQLLFLYGDKYDFEVSTSDRHGGKSILICPIHGKVEVDNDYIFMGNGCYKCNNSIAPDLFYLVKLKNETQEFYKLGISGYDKNKKVKRFKQYESLGYSVEVLKIKEFKTPLECREYETKLKRIIKPFLIIPEVWDNKTSTECFDLNIEKFINSYINDDIV
jgi:hypothetical protein